MRRALKRTIVYQLVFFITALSGGDLNKFESIFQLFPVSLADMDLMSKKMYDLKKNDPGIRT